MAAPEGLARRRPPQRIHPKGPAVPILTLAVVVVGLALGIVGLVLAVRRNRSGLGFGIAAIVTTIVGIALGYLAFDLTAWAGLVGLVAVALGVISIPLARRAPATSQGAVAPAGLGAGRTNGLALASIIVVWFSSIVGLILGHVALSQIRKTGEDGRGMAVTAVSVGWVFTALSVIGGIIVAIVYANAFRGY
ncbi:DUF4190 domain-containing protein [Agromyces sp. MMS24-JH15]|uniref:DUF4190 domain-containing protein n=1 Tax=Agromyces sp. MMS24-JH15 TaxID=3243765 RepID=UPI003749151D